MNKKLMAVAVAAAMAPGLALAQSSVTISGIFKVGVDNYRVGSRTGSNTSETRVTDNSSRIIFNVTEDLGGGLQAIGQLDVRFQTDLSALAGSGNIWAGLRSKSWGTVTLGRHDLHYGKQPDDIASKSGALMAAAVSLMDYAAGGTAAIAITSRTANVVRYDLPQMGMFGGTIAWSSNPGGQEADMTAANNSRKGSAVTFNPVLTGSNWQGGYSYWRSKNDVAAAATNQRGDVLYGFFKTGGFKLGLAWNKSRISSGVDGVVSSQRTSWTIPVSYNWGPNTVYAHYTKAGDDSAAAFQGTDEGAKMWAVAYNYDLSKRTSAGVTYAKITNNTNARYNLFTVATYGGVNSATAVGEDPRVVSVTLRHAF